MSPRRRLRRAQGMRSIRPKNLFSGGMKPPALSIHLFHLLRFSVFPPALFFLHSCASSATQAHWHAAFPFFKNLLSNHFAYYSVIRPYRASTGLLRNYLVYLSASSARLPDP